MQLLLIQSEKIFQAVDLMGNVLLLGGLSRTQQAQFVTQIRVLQSQTS